MNNSAQNRITPKKIPNENLSGIITYRTPNNDNFLLNNLLDYLICVFIIACLGRTKHKLE